MRLSGQVIDLVRLNLGNHLDDGTGVGQIAIMQDNLAANVIDAAGGRQRRTANDAVNLVALLQQELCKIRAILASNAGN